ncbi:phosphatidylserine decarboxylase [Methanosarcinaceae archaeon]|nr:phosphatidylserine decarboxylase [Methanosarcinaceae archaeon]
MLAKGCKKWLSTTILSTVFFFILYFMTRAYIILGVAVVFLGLSVFFTIFFRDPERHGVISEDHMLSPADGRIIDIRNRKLCIFMNLSDVHVNRAPMDGRVLSVTHYDGGYMPAFNKDAATNERSVMKMETPYGIVEITQIAGAWVRRIHSYVRPGDTISQKQRFGVILFGSRVDITIPDDFELCVSENDKVKAGTTVIARRMRPEKN